MNVKLRLFASLREALGVRQLDVELPDGATVDDLRSRLGEMFPEAESLLACVAFAVEDDYVSAEAALHDGAEVAAIPPVSGGAGDLFRVTTDRLVADELVALVQRDEAGAVSLFYGNVRNHNDDRRVIRLEYEAHESMALRKLAETATETRQRFPEVTEVGAWHRIGTLEIGETSLLVAVSAPHRKEAIEACHWCVDRIKKVVPVWKKEYFEGGAVWVDGHIVEPK